MKTTFFIALSLLLTGSTYAQGEQSNCYDELSSIAMKQAGTGSYVTALFTPSMISGGVVGSMFGGAGVGLGVGSIYQARQTYLIKMLYDQALVGQGPLINELYNQVIPSESRTSDDEASIAYELIDLVDGGYVCEQLHSRDTYDLKDIVTEIKE